MKTSIYNRISEIATPELAALRGLWAGLCADRPTPRRHDYWGKCLLRASLELEQRARPDAHSPTGKSIRK